MTSLLIHHLSLPLGGHLLPGEHHCLYFCFPRCDGDFFLPVSYPSKPCNNLLEAYTAMLDKFTKKPSPLCWEATTDLAQFSLTILKHAPPAGRLKDAL